MKVVDPEKNMIRKATKKFKSQDMMKILKNHLMDQYEN